MKPLTPASSPTYATVNVPEDGVDPRTAASLEPAFQSLADRDAYILKRFRKVADLTALGALTSNAAGDMAEVDGYGIYSYTASTITADGLTFIAASGGGTWQSAAASVGMVPRVFGRILCSSTTPNIQAKSGTTAGLRGIGFTAGYVGNNLVITYDATLPGVCPFTLTPSAGYSGSIAYTISAAHTSTTLTVGGVKIVDSGSVATSGTVLNLNGSGVSFSFIVFV